MADDINETLRQALESKLGIKLDRAKPLDEARSIVNLIGRIEIARRIIASDPELTQFPLLNLGTPGTSYPERRLAEFSLRQGEYQNLAPSELRRQAFWQTAIPNIVAQYIYERSGKQTNEAERRYLLNQLAKPGNTQELAVRKLGTFVEGLKKDAVAFLPSLGVAEKRAIAPVMQAVLNPQHLEAATNSFYDSLNQGSEDISYPDLGIDAQGASWQGSFKGGGGPFGNGAATISRQPAPPGVGPVIQSNPAAQPPARQPFAPKPQRVNPLLQRVQQ